MPTGATRVFVSLEDEISGAAVSRSPCSDVSIGTSSDVLWVNLLHEGLGVSQYRKYVKKEGDREILSAFDASF